MEMSVGRRRPPLGSSLAQPARAHLIEQPHASLASGNTCELGPGALNTIHLQAKVGTGPGVQRRRGCHSASRLQRHSLTSCRAPMTSTSLPACRSLGDPPDLSRQEMTRPPAAHHQVAGSNTNTVHLTAQLVGPCVTSRWGSRAEAPIFELMAPENPVQQAIHPEKLENSWPTPQQGAGAGRSRPCGGGGGLVDISRLATAPTHRPARPSP